jgi:hypothetical protein
LADCRMNRALPVRPTAQGIIGKRRKFRPAERNVAMRIPVLIISAASLIALGGIAKADDHLFQAEQPGHGLSEDSNAFNNAQAFEHEEVPGQGSPFTGNEEHQTPASSVALEKPNANIKPKEH